MENNLDITIPASAIAEWKSGIEDGAFANQWWQTLTQEQRKCMTESAIYYLRKQKIKDSQALSARQTQALIQLSRSAGCLELVERDNHLFISGSIKRSSFGVEGECYSQQSNFVGSMCDDFLGLYYDNTKAHECGQQTVDIVCYALNALPNVIASETPFNSVADVGLRWDVIVKWNNYYFPVQVKSSYQGIQTALKSGDLSNYALKKIEQLEKMIEKIAIPELADDRSRISFKKRPVNRSAISHYQKNQETTGT